ncbi:MAG: hypothetical protein AAF740_05540 [Bacteroidota bacterium]
MMEKLNDIEVDLLLKIDFFTLTSYGDRENYTDAQFEKDKVAFKRKYNLKRTFQRREGGYEYIRLADLKDDFTPYVKYLSDLRSINRFWCCPLEQAVGLFQSEEMKIFFSTEAMYCFNLRAHLSAIEEMHAFASIEEWSQQSYLDINTFCGTQKGERLLIEYNPNTFNIQPNDEDNLEYEVSATEFKEKLTQLKKHIRLFYTAIKKQVKNLPSSPEDEDLEDVFNDKFDTPYEY